MCVAHFKSEIESLAVAEIHSRTHTISEPIVKVRGKGNKDIAEMCKCRSIRNSKTGNRAQCSVFISIGCRSRLRSQKLFHWPWAIGWLMSHVNRRCGLIQCRYFSFEKNIQCLWARWYAGCVVIKRYTFSVLHRKTLHTTCLAVPHTTYVETFFK